MAHAEVHSAGSRISVGEAEPYSCLKSATVVGTRCMQAVFITTNLAISSLAVSFLGLSACSLLMASKPNGVAAFPRPRIFAVIFIAIASRVLSSFSRGNNSFKRGESNLQRALVNPLSSAICIRPFQRQIIPISLILRLIASVPPEMIADDKLLSFPVAIAHINEKIIIAGHI